MFRVIVIEDNAFDCLRFYLRPLHRLIEEQRIQDARVDVWIIGSVKSAHVARLREKAAAFPKLAPVIHHHPLGTLEDLVKDLTEYLSEASLVMVDRSARGREWKRPTTADEDWPADALERWPADALSKRLARTNTVPIIRVSDYTKVEFNEYDIDDVAAKGLARRDLVMKRDDEELFYVKFAETVIARVNPSLARAQTKKGARGQGLVEYLRSIEGTHVDAIQRRSDLDTYAKLALLNLLNPKRRGPATVTAATARHAVNWGNHTHESPYLKRGRSHRLHRFALARRVLIGLQKIWFECGPPSKGEEGDYSLWLDVVANGYRDLPGELKAIKVLAESIRASGVEWRLTEKAKILGKSGHRGTLHVIDLSRIHGTMFRRVETNLKVTKAYIERSSLDSMPEVRQVRFFDGHLFFEHFNMRGAMVEYRFALEWTGLNEEILPLPTDTSDKWDRFYRNADVPTLTPRREGYLDATQSLASQLGLGIGDMYDLHKNATPQEEAWWASLKGDVAKTVRPAGPQFFDAEKQAAARATCIAGRLGPRRR